MDGRSNSHFVMGQLMQTFLTRLRCKQKSCENALLTSQLRAKFPTELFSKPATEQDGTKQEKFWLPIFEKRWPWECDIGVHGQFSFEGSGMKMTRLEY